MAGLRDFLLPFLRKKVTFSAPLAPDKAFVAIGDVHGRLDLLQSLLDHIESEAPTLPKVFVGDFIDRGPDSAAVLRHVMAMSERSSPSVICLKGNHEAMFLDFVDTPEQGGPQWLRNGGDKTLESFGVDPPVDCLDGARLNSARDALVEQAGADLIAWVRSLPLAWQSGNVIVTHAGGDPSQPIEPRRSHGLLWGHPDFLRKPRQDGNWIVHGHFIVSIAGTEAGRIAVDTGAYKTGRLSAAIIRNETPQFLST